MAEIPPSFIVEFERPSPATVAAAALPTATLHEAQGRRGALPGAIKPVSGSMRICGPAVTVSCPPGDNLRIHHALAVARPGDVLVVGVGDGQEYGYWGEVLSVSAHARGLGGLVIDGGVRDVDQLVSLGFPVFSRGVCIRGTLKQPQEPGSINHPIVIGDARIAPGDVVVGDADGVVVVERAEVDAVVAASHKREALEAEQMEALRAGATTVELFGFDPGVLS